MYDALIKTLKAMLPLMACGAIGGLICFRHHYLLGWAIGWTVGMFFYGDKWLSALKEYVKAAQQLNDNKD